MTRFGYRLNDVFDMVDRIGDAGIFGLRTVVKVDGAVGQYDHVLQQSIAANRMIDIRFCGF